MKSDDLVVDRPPTTQDAKPKTTPPPMYNVFLFNDPTTPGILVADLLHKHFNVRMEQAWNVMIKAHKDGMAIVVVLPKDIAETKVHLCMTEARAAHFTDFHVSAEPVD